MHSDSGNALAAVLPPALRDLLRGRALTLERPVWGQRAGRHLSARAGLGHLFRAHRPYVAGDDPRLLDWRAMARRDRPMLRQTEGEDELSLCALVDLSGTMAYGEGETSKRRTAAAMVAALAHLALRQGDRFGFATGGDGALGLAHLRPSASASRLGALAAALSEGELRGLCPWRELVAAAAPRLPRRALVVAVSDFLDPCPPTGGATPEVEATAGPGPEGACVSAEEELWGAFAGLRARGHDVVLLQVLHPDELDPPWRGDEFLRILDPKGSRSAIKGTANALKRRYQARFAAHQRALTRHCEANGIYLLRVRSDAPLEEALLDLLARLSGLTPSPSAGSSAATNKPAKTAKKSRRGPP